MTTNPRLVVASAVVVLAVACSAPPEPADRSFVAVSRMEGSPLSECTGDERRAQAGTLYEGTEVEGHLASDPSDGDHIVAAWQQDRWNNGAARGVVAGVSRDGGRTWTETVDTNTSACTGGTYRRVTDPWVSIGPDGTTYLATLAVDPDVTSPFGANPDAILVARSDDGSSWDEPVTLVRDTDPSVHNDKPSVTAHPYRPGTVYATWGTLTNDNRVISGVTSWSSSTDAGRTWDEPRTIYKPKGVASTLGSQVVVLPETGGSNGELVVIATVVATDVETGTFSFRLVAITSDDGGAEWWPGSTIAETEPKEATDPASGEPVVGGRLLADVAVDPRTGRIYVVWLDGAGGTRHNRVLLSSSDDAGRSWTKPVAVNLTPSAIPAPNRQVILPAVHVLADGTVGVAYLDFRNNGDGDPLETDAFLASCSGTACARGDGWSEARMTPKSFDLHRAPVTQGRFIGDYIGLAGDDNDFLALFGVVDGHEQVTQQLARVSPRK